MERPAVSLDPSRDPRYLQSIRCKPWDPQVFAFPHSAALKSLTRPTGITLKAEISHRLKISDTAPRKPRILTELSYEPKSCIPGGPRSHRPDFPGLLGCAFFKSLPVSGMGPQTGTSQPGPHPTSHILGVARDTQSCLRCLTPDPLPQAPRLL